jgi:hypothetical protein
VDRLKPHTGQERVEVATPPRRGRPLGTGGRDDSPLVRLGWGGAVVAADCGKSSEKSANVYTVIISLIKLFS